MDVSPDAIRAARKRAELVDLGKGRVSNDV